MNLPSLLREAQAALQVLQARRVQAAHKAHQARAVRQAHQVRCRPSQR